MKRIRVRDAEAAIYEMFKKALNRGEVTYSFETNSEMAIRYRKDADYLNSKIQELRQEENGKSMYTESDYETALLYKSMAEIYEELAGALERCGDDAPRCSSCTRPDRELKRFRSYLLCSACVEHYETLIAIKQEREEEPQNPQSNRFTVEEDRA